jgi:ArsR family transcriptional regulator, arsenate/arsenite/antimonite-responsive transcriptional repressor
LALPATGGRAQGEVVNGSTPIEGLRALADPVRWAIVEELRGGTCCACVLADTAGVSAPLLSHHLKVLREAGLVTSVKRGRWVDYTLDDEALDRLASIVARPVRSRP